MITFRFTESISYLILTKSLIFTFFIVMHDGVVARI